MDVAYWTVVFAGAVTLLVEAYRQFSSTDDIHTHDRYPILKDVDLNALCTSAELLRGFLTYASLYIGAYAMILGSTEVFEIVAGSSSTDGTNEAIESLIVGARDLSQDSGAVMAPDDAFALGKPIFVSAAIITALSMGIFAPVEKIIRSYAHWIAAIPRGVYRVISGLKRINYDAIGKKIRLPMLEKFEEKLAGLDHDAINDDALEDIRASLKACDLMQPAVTGQLRDRLFTAMMPSALDALIQKQDEEGRAFYIQLRELTDDPDKFQNFQLAAVRQCNNMQALFALLYIRNHKSVDTTQLKNPAIKMIEHIQQDREPAYHALSGAIFIMVLSVLILFPLTYYITLYLLPEGYIRPMGEIRGLALDDPNFNTFIAEPNFGVAVTFIRNETIIAFLQNILVFFICSGTALLSREASKEYGHWKDWELNQIPFLRLFQHSIFPGVAAVIICVVIKLFEYLLAVQGAGNFDEFVRDNWEFCLMNFVFGFCISFSLFVIVDQHEKLPAYKTITIGFFAILPYLLWAFFVQSLDSTNPTYLSNSVWLLREVFLLFVPALSFALAFAVLIEWSEKKGTAK